MSFLTDFSRVNGLGSAKAGTEHFWSQRLTAILNAVLLPFFLFPFAANLGDGYEAVREAYSHPFTAITAALFAISVFYHIKLGLQVVIEDYIHGGLRTLLIIATNFFAFAAGGTAVFSIAKLAFV